MIKKLTIVCCFLCFCSSYPQQGSTLSAYDREVMVEIKDTQKQIPAMMQEINQRLTRLETRGHGSEKRLDGLDNRIGDLKSDTNKQSDNQFNLTIIQITSIFGLIDFEVWDRKHANIQIASATKKIKSILDQFAMKNNNLKEITNASDLRFT